MPSCMFEYMFVGVRISIFTPKIMSGTLSPLEAEPVGHPYTDREVEFRQFYTYV